ncbi:MAG: hypothetical protein ACLVJH_19330 [Faecalibacterium prausnitzii]
MPRNGSGGSTLTDAAGQGAAFVRCFFPCPAAFTAIARAWRYRRLATCPAQAGAAALEVEKRHGLYFCCAHCCGAKRPWVGLAAGALSTALAAKERYTGGGLRQH